MIYLISLISQCIQQDIERQRRDLEKITEHAQKLEEESPNNESIKVPLAELVKRFEKIETDCQVRHGIICCLQFTKIVVGMLIFI